jgi:hypothetical protein
MSKFADLIAFEGDREDEQSWRQRQLELEEQYYEQYEEEERPARKERARDINSVGKHYY